MPWRAPSIDTGAWGLQLPRAWKERLGTLQVLRTVELVTADQRVVTGEVCGPVTVRIEGFEPVWSEVTFVEMELESGRYAPLLGYTVLEQAGVAVDVVGGRLLKIPHMDGGGPGRRPRAQSGRHVTCRGRPTFTETSPLASPRARPS